jgi:dipeptidyl aminopeptidase/acylaminoacyl peptidase
LVWAGNTGRYGNDFTWGERALYVADFRFEGGVPQLLNTKTLQPGQRKDFYESHGFAPDGNSVLFSANLGKEQPIYGMDICLMDVRTGTITMLTDTPTVWDEFASVSPDGKKVTWMTNAGQDVHFRAFGTTDWQRYLKSELWLMNADGSDPKQLTFFNSPGFPEHTGRRCFVGHNCWSNDGRNIAVCVHFETGSWQLEPKVLLLELGVGPAPDLVPQKLKPVEPAKPPMPLPDDRIRKPTTGGVPFRWGK